MRRWPRPGCGSRPPEASRSPCTACPARPVTPTWPSPGSSSSAPSTPSAIRVVTPEDFVLLKLLSTRERDLEDARTVVAALPDVLDRALLDREVALLAAEIPDHDVAGRATRVLAP